MTPEAQVRMALQALRADWLRSVPSALGVIIGIALLVALSSIRAGARAALDADLERLGANMIILDGESVVQTGRHRVADRRHPDPGRPRRGGGPLWCDGRGASTERRRGGRYRRADSGQSVRLGDHTALPADPQLHSRAGSTALRRGRAPREPGHRPRRRSCKAALSRLEPDRSQRPGARPRVHRRRRVRAQGKPLATRTWTTRLSSR